MNNLIILDNLFTKNMYEGHLTPIENNDIQVKGGLNKFEDIQKFQPAVSIGYPPEAVKLEEYFKLRKASAPPEFSTLLSIYDYFLQFFAITIRPVAGSQVEWVDFNVAMRSLKYDRNPIAYDMCPFEVIDEPSTARQLSLSPKLKFSFVELSIGDFLVHLDGISNKPAIKAFGLFEPSPHWHIRRYGKSEFEGSRKFAMVIQAPKQAKGMRITQSIVAGITSQYGAGRYQTEPSLHHRLSFVTRES